MRIIFEQCVQNKSMKPGVNDPDICNSSSSDQHGSFIDALRGAEGEFIGAAEC